VALTVEQDVGGSRAGPIGGGLRLVPGSLRLILLRWALVLLAALPAALAALAAVAAGPARTPYITEVQGPLPVFHLLRLARELPLSVAALALLGAGVALLGQQILGAGALSWLAPGRERLTSIPSVAGAVLREGTPWLWTMLRVVLLAAVLAAAGLAGLGWIHERLALCGEPAGWSGRTIFLLLPAARGATSLLWLSLVGAWAFWCRVLLIADSRRTVRSVGVLVLRVWWRHPLRAPLFYVGVVLAMLLASALTLLWWRQAPPVDLGGALLLGLSWLLLLLLKAVAWHWLLRAGRLLYAGPSLDDLRRRPDGPLGLGRLLAGAWRRVRRRRARAA